MKGNVGGQGRTLGVDNQVKGGKPKHLICCLPYSVLRALAPLSCGKFDDDLAALQNANAGEGMPPQAPGSSAQLQRLQTLAVLIQHSFRLC